MEVFDSIYPSASPSSHSYSTQSFISYSPLDPRLASLCFRFLDASWLPSLILIPLLSSCHPAFPSSFQTFESALVLSHHRCSRTQKLGKGSMTTKNEHSLSTLGFCFFFVPLRCRVDQRYTANGFPENSGRQQTRKSKSPKSEVSCIYQSAADVAVFLGFEWMRDELMSPLLVDFLFECNCQRCQIHPM